jgi:hypothetical protein
MVSTESGVARQSMSRCFTFNVSPRRTPKSTAISILGRMTLAEYS